MEKSSFGSWSVVYLNGASNRTWCYQRLSYVKIVLVPVRHYKVDSNISLDRVVAHGGISDFGTKIDRCR
jgi:hypothetical protein